jgi:hypothetical protein
VAAILMAVTLIGCEDPTRRRRELLPYVVLEKGAYQSVYRADGSLDRLLYDRNEDRVADGVILYDTRGKVLQAQIDTDLDHAIDRWEYFEDGKLATIGLSHSQPGIPESFLRVAPK